MHMTSQIKHVFQRMLKKKKIKLAVCQEPWGYGMMEGTKPVGSLEDWKGTECWSHRAEPSEKENKMGDRKKGLIEFEKSNQMGEKTQPH